MVVDGHGQSRASSRLVFYIDTDADKIAFIDWYVKKVDTVKSLFEQTRLDRIQLKLLHSAPGQSCQSRGETGSRCPHAYVCVCICVCVGIVLSPIGNETL